MSKMIEEDIIAYSNDVGRHPDQETDSLSKTISHCVNVLPDMCGNLSSSTRIEKGLILNNDGLEILLSKSGRKLNPSEIDYRVETGGQHSMQQVDSKFHSQQTVIVAYAKTLPTATSANRQVVWAAVAKRSD